MQPKISIVVPSYNHARFIPQCVESVLAQTMSDWEMIVVDDRSTDDSMAVWQSYADPRIKIFQNEQNLGTYGNQNRGVALASSDLIAILNSDDFWEPTKLELQLKALEKHPNAAFCYTHGWLAPDDNPTERKRDQHEDWPLEEEQELLPWLLQANRALASSVIFRKPFAAFDSDRRYSGDWLSLFKASIHQASVFVPDKLTYWRIHASNTFSLAKGATAEEIEMRREMLAQSSRWLGGRWDKGQVERGLGVCAVHLSALYVLWGDMKLARQTVRTALRWQKKAALRRWAVCHLPRSAAMKALWPQAGEGFRLGPGESFRPLSLD